MHPKNFTLLALVSVLAATGAWSLGAQQATDVQADTASAEACQAELDPAVVAAGSEASVTVTFPSDAGEIEAVRSEEGSGIAILAFDPVAPGLSALIARLEVPKDAAGTWWLEFDAAGATCTALLTVNDVALDR